MRGLTNRKQLATIPAKTSQAVRPASLCFMGGRPVAWVGRINKDQGDPERAEGDKVYYAGRASGRRRRSDSGAAFGAPSRRTDLRDQRDRSGRASVAGNTNTTVVLLWRPGMPVGR